MNDKEVMLSCCGVDEDSLPRGAAALKMAKIHLRDEKEEILDELILDTPVISMHRGVKFTMIDLVFRDPDDFAFINSVARLQKFTRAMHSAEGEDSNDGTIPTIAVTVVPHELMDEYFISGMHGIWCVMPSHIGSANDTLRFIFTNDCFHVFCMDRDTGGGGHVGD